MLRRGVALTSSLALLPSSFTAVAATSPLLGSTSTSSAVDEQRRCYSRPKVKRANKLPYIRIANKTKVDIGVAINYTLKTRLATVSPRLAAEWDFERNPGHVYPKLLGCGDITPYWWRCGDCGAHFKMSTEQRILRKGGCATCSRTAAEKLAASREAAAAAAGSEDELLEGELVASSAKAPASDVEEADDGLLEGERQVSRPAVLRSRAKFGKL